MSLAGHTRNARMWMNVISACTIAIPMHFAPILTAALVVNCKRGFNGDGKENCTKTCYERCVNGYCSEAPDYKCECNLGWTGPDCRTNLRLL